MTQSGQIYWTKSQTKARNNNKPISQYFNHSSVTGFGCYEPGMWRNNTIQRLNINCPTKNDWTN